MSEIIPTIDDLTFCEVKMENPLSSKNGKGFVTYSKDGKEYILEAMFVNGRKEGHAILRTLDGQEVGSYYFYHDQQCNEEEYKKHMEEERNPKSGNDASSSHAIQSKGNAVSELPISNKENAKQHKKNFISSPIFVIAMIVCVLVIGILLYHGICYLMTANKLSNGVLTLSSCREFRHIPGWIEQDVQSIVIQDRCCNGDSSVHSVSFSRFANCQSIVIGENAMTEVDSMDIRSMPSLQSLSIGDGSLRKLTVLSMDSDSDNNVNVEWKWTVHSSDEIRSIPGMVSDLWFNKNSNSDSTTKSLVDSLDLTPIFNLHAVHFEANSLPNVKSLHMGNLHRLHTLDISQTALSGVEQVVISSYSLDSANFTNLDLSALTNLQTVEVGTHSLTNMKTVKATGLTNLQSFKIEEGSLMRARE